MAWYNFLPTCGWIVAGVVTAAIIIIIIVAATRSTTATYTELRPMRHVPGIASGARARPAYRR